MKKSEKNQEKCAENFPLGENIKRMRETLGISQSDFAQKTGFSPSYISLIEGGGRTGISPQVLSKVAAVLGVETSVLFQEQTTTKFVRIPIIAEIPCGTPQPPTEATGDFWEVPATIGAAGKYALRAKGICMYDRISDGDIVIVDTLAEPQNGDIVPFKIFDGGIDTAELRYYYKRGNVLEFKAYNPDFKTILLTHADSDDEGDIFLLEGKRVRLYLKGRVCGLYQKL